MNRQKNQSIKIMVLGGVNEFGKNMYLVEIDEDIFVLDAGLMLPENEMLGIDIVIPDITYLIHNKERVQGIFLTHGHEDHIGALSYIVRELNVPIYGTRLTIAIAKAKVKQQGYKGKPNFIEISTDSFLEFQSAQVSFYHTTHSIPDSVGICIHTTEGNIVYTGDFKFDQAATNFYRTDIQKIAQIGGEGVLCLLSDSTEAEKPGYTQSESKVVKQVIDSFVHAPGRIIAASFASDLIRIQHIFDAAKESQRKVAIIGNFTQTAVDIAIQYEYLHIADDILIPFGDIHTYPDDEIVLLTTGIQGEPIEVLQKMAKQTHKQVTIKKGDTVLLAASPLRGSEVIISRTIDMLYRAGANVISGKGTFNTSSHGSQEELKFMINLMKPSFFIPVHGEYRMLKAHAKIAKECGLKDNQIVIPEKGDVLEIAEGSIRPAGRIPSGNVLIDGSGVGDVGNIVLRDRKLLSQDGILLVVVTLNKKEKKISAGPEIISRGFVYVRESEELLVEATNRVREIVVKSISKDSFDWNGIKQEMRDELNQYFYEKTKRRPMILPIIMEV
ncbi:ribonuclease J [Cytobacillus eiseniae]|uniref:Ribonuclease J n=1 Tax=Cytobacillus eiseniae TaxID=762947 RepID=A0ABS4RBB3_9BACI|nr:ribonuclease J [Cytobacillus eiseniae]MBP2240185.1 ribonuclease J [Cytobacillus eiseniae]